MMEKLQEQQTLEQMNEKLQKAAAQERQHRRRRRLATTVLTWMLAIVAALAVVTVLTVVVMVLSGRSKLLHRTQGAAPSLAFEESETEPEETESSSYVWEEGWVRYGDKIYQYNDDIMTFLIMGVDKMTPVAKAKDTTDGGQTDGLFLVVVNPHEKDVKIIAINRDTIVDVYMFGFEENGVTPVTKAEIAVQHGFGDGLEQSCEATVDAVSKLFYDLPISGYAAINMGAIEQLAKAVDGVDLDVLEDLTKVNSAWEKGAHVHLAGRSAYDYVHWRDTTVFESARGRLARQKQFLSIYIDKLKARTKEDITLPVRLYGLISQYMVTNVSVDQVAYLATQLIDYDFDPEDIYTMEGTTITGEKFEEFYPDYDALKDLMIQVFYEEVNPEAGS